MRVKKYRFLPHTADVKIEAYGATLEKALANAVTGLGEAISGSTGVPQKARRLVEARGRDREAMSHNFMEEVLYLADADDFVPATAKNVTVRGNTATAVLSGCSMAELGITNAVKAVTYNELAVRRSSAGWTLLFVLDV